MSWLDELDSSAAVKALAEQLEGIPKLARVVGRDDAVADAWAIATGLRDIRESVEKIFGHLVPALLTADPRSADAEGLLYSIGEEYRHMLYHITESRFFGYLSTDSTAHGERDEPI